MIYIDKYAYINRLKDVHPLEKFLFATVTLFITIAANSIIVPAIVFWAMTAAILIAARIPLLFYGKLLLLPVFFLSAGLFSVATNADSSDFLLSVSFFQNRLGVSASSLHDALLLFMKAMGSISCLYFLVLTVPVIEIIHILKRLKTPILFLELLVIVYRFIFIIFETMSRIYVSQKSRLGFKDWKTSYRSLGRLVSSLFIISLKRFEDMHNALESRCFTGDFHFYRRPHVFSKTGIFFIIVFDSFLFGISVWFGGKL